MCLGENKGDRILKGPYIKRLRTGDFTRIRKMFMVK